MAGHAKGIVLVLLLECGLLCSGCAGMGTRSAPDNANQLSLLGVWSGMSVNDCSPVQVEPSRCRAVERISLTLLDQNGKASGFYRCAPGTTPCYNQVDRGEITYLKLTGHALLFRVMRDDHSSCIFEANPATNEMKGEFWCFNGSAVIERGFFRVVRAY